MIEYQSELDPSLIWATPADIDAWRLANPGNPAADFLRVIVVPIPDPHEGGTL